MINYIEHRKEFEDFIAAILAIESVIVGKILKRRGFQIYTQGFNR